MADSDIILQKTYAFLKYLIPQLEKFPRSQKFLLADRMEIIVLDILENYISAYYSPGNKKLTFLKDSNLKLEKLRYLTRLSHDFQYLNHKKYGLISGFIDEIGRMTGGWIKKINQA